MAHRVLLMALATFLTATVSARQDAEPSAWTARVQPHRVMAGIYYVGTLDLSSFLVTSAAGHVLIDSGVEANADAIMENIRALGFSVRDVRVILTTQAHFDHVAAHARLQKASGARVLVAAADAPLVEGGGKGDYLFGPKYLLSARQGGRDHRRRGGRPGR